MFKQLLWGVLAACVLAAPACANPAEVDTRLFGHFDDHVGDYRNIHTVGVIVTLGNTLRISRQSESDGINKTTRDITAWQMDALARSVVEPLLGQRFHVVDIPLDPAAAIARGGDALRSLHRDDIDAFVIIRPRFQGLFADDRNALSVSASDNNEQTSWFYAFYEIVLLDAKTFAEIARCDSRMRLEDGVAPNPPSILPRIAPEPGLDGAFTDAQMPMVKEWVARLVRRSLIETLRSLKFDIALPHAREATVQPRPDAFTVLAPGAKVAIVSAAADIVTLDHDTALFGRGARTLPIGDLKLDARIEALAAAALDHRYTVVPPPPGVDRATLASHAMGRDYRGLYDGLPTSSDIDAYIVVMKCSDGPVPDTAHIGISLAIAGKRVRVIAAYGIGVIDARTHKIISNGSAQATPNREVATPQAPVDAALWTDGQFTPTQAGGLRTAVDGLLVDSIPETLLQIGLTDQMLVTPDETPLPTRKAHPHPQAADPDDAPPAKP